MRQAGKPLVLVAALVALAVASACLKRSAVYLLALYCVYLMATMGLNLTVGYAGQMSLGHAAFFGIGAYHAAILLKLGWPFFAVLALAATTSIRRRTAGGWEVRLGGFTGARTRGAPPGSPAIQAGVA